MNDAPKIGMAFIGLGWWGAVLADAALASGKVKVTGGFARTPTTREDFVGKYGGKNFTSIDEVMADSETEAVVIATANSVHKDIAIAAARAGKHIHLEKPMALSVSDAKSIEQACRDSGVKLHMGQNFRRWPMFRKAKEIVDSGDLGLVNYTVATFSNNHGFTSGPKSMRWDATENPGGPLYSYTIHLADMMEYLFGDVDEVSGSCAKVGGPNPQEDAAAAILRFKSGLMGVISSSYLAPFHFAYDIQGTEANLSLSTTENPTLKRPIDLMGGLETKIVELYHDLVEGRLLANREQFDDLVDAIREDRDPEVTGRHGVRALAIMRAILKSNAERRIVTIEEILETD